LIEKTGQFTKKNKKIKETFATMTSKMISFNQWKFNQEAHLGQANRILPNGSCAGTKPPSCTILDITYAVNFCRV
jgi:hypothetical protein